jgi:hypothetical protein
MMLVCKTSEHDWNTQTRRRAAGGAGNAPTSEHTQMPRQSALVLDVAAHYSRYVDNHLGGVPQVQGLEGTVRMHPSGAC